MQLTKEQIEKQIARLENELEGDTYYAIHEPYAQEFIRMAKAYLAEVEHHEAHINKLERRLDVRNEYMGAVDKFNFDTKLNYHRSRLAALKGEG